MPRNCASTGSTAVTFTGAFYGSVIAMQPTAGKAALSGNIIARLCWKGFARYSFQTPLVLGGLKQAYMAIRAGTAPGQLMTS